MPHLPTILIVDDSSTTRAMIKRVIGMTSLAVGALLEAGDGQAGLDVMASQHVDLVLADLNMPVMEGSVMIAAMRRSPALRAIPVVVISAQPDPLQVEQLKRDGVAGYLSKPFTPEAVFSMVSPLLASRPPAVVLQSTSSFNLTLAEALVEALETMAFMSPQLPENPGLNPPPADVRVVRVNFHGDGMGGSLAIAASAKFGEAVADSCAESETAHDPDDALKELANVTCGLLLRKRLGGGVGFKMDPPFMGQPDELSSWENNADVVAVEADGHLVTAHVTTADALVITAGEHSR